MRFVATLGSTVFALACALAHAAGTDAASGRAHNRYKWRDAAGELHYGDALPADAAKYGYDVVNAQGIVVRHVERAKTPEEQAAASAELAKTQAAQADADARSRADAQLLAGYPTEADLDRAQKQKLELLDQQANAARVSLRSQEQALGEMLDRAAEVERGGKALPEAQARQLADLRRQVEELRLAVTRRESEREQALAQFAQETARYRALKAGADAR
ncbi:MAG TPA: DUF4124 domain-containing protein [Dokdonella sp.]